MHTADIHSTWVIHLETRERRGGGVWEFPGHARIRYKGPRLLLQTQPTSLCLQEQARENTVACALDSLIELSPPLPALLSSCWSNYHPPVIQASSSQPGDAQLAGLSKPCLEVSQAAWNGLGTTQGQPPTVRQGNSWPKSCAPCGLSSCLPFPPIKGCRDPWAPPLSFS